MKETFISVEPKSELLRKYISYYYFHKSESPSNYLSFSYYPHYKNALTIYRNSKVEIVEAAHTKASPDQEEFTFHYARIYTSFCKAEIVGSFDKIGVVFQPLGLNHFVSEQNISTLTQEINVDISFFKESFSPLLGGIYDESDPYVKVDLLDSYFLSQFIYSPPPQMKEIIDFLFSSDEKTTVSELSERFQLNRKSLFRLFQRHLNCSPKEYITLIRFRKAVDVYLNTSKKPTLTRLALDLDYYDQSDFIHRFKKITGMNPRNFFKNIEKYGVHSTFWTNN